MVVGCCTIYVGKEIVVDGCFPVPVFVAFCPDVEYCFGGICVRGVLFGDNRFCFTYVILCLQVKVCVAVAVFRVVSV